MTWLNYHHLQYFWTVAREGSVTRAAAALHLSQPTVSGQVRALERALKAKLFDKRGRGLVLTDAGRAVFRYADDIFALGRELVDAVSGRTAVGQPVRLRVGVVDAVPKAVAHLLLRPALRLPEPVRVECVEGKLDRLAADLAVHELDVVLSDAPLPDGFRAKVYTHLLGQSGVAVAGVARLARDYRAGFPACLDRAPFLLPLGGTALRRSLDGWFAAHGVRPVVRGEFEDSALLKAFARAGEGLVAVPTAVASDLRRHDGLRRVGRVDGVRERFYAISAERKLTHPAVVAICEQARRKLPEATA